MSNRLIKILFFLTISITISYSQSISKTLKNHSIQSNSNYLDDGFIEKVSSHFDSIEILAMGEASHGASEFFKIKAEFFKYLVVEKGFRVLVIESTLATTYSLNKYLLYGEGNAGKSLKQLDNFFWNTREVLDLINWISIYNRDKTLDAKIFFYGMDTNSRKSSIGVIEEYLNKVDKELVSKYRAEFPKLFDTKKKENKEGLRALAISFESNREDFIEKSSSWEYEFVKQCFVVLNQRGGKRDFYMSENISWLKELTQSNIFVWAHNNHVSKSQNYLGYYLREKYKDKYYSIGFDFKEGEFWAKKGGNVFSVLLNGNKFIKCKANPPKEDYLTNAISQIGKPLVYFDISDCIESSPDLRNLFTSTQMIHNTSEWYSPKSEYLETVVGYQYDGLLYVERIHPSGHFYLEEKYPESVR